MKDILLVEDNMEIAGLTRLFLEKAGYEIEHIANGDEAIAYLSANKVKMLLLDLMLPGADGFAICRSARKQGNVPVLIISARSEKEDKMTAYRLGADDYIEKPFDMDLLLVKIQALMNRIYPIQRENERILSGDMEIDCSAHKVWIQHKEISLNVKEYELLYLFVQNPGKVLDKDYIFNEIWGAYSESENQTLTVHIRMLRDKIEKDKKNPKRIQTVWGVGYRYEEV